MRQSIVNARVTVYRHADREAPKAIDISRYAQVVSTSNSIAGSAQWSVTFKAGLYRASDFSPLDFCQIEMDDGRVNAEGRRKGLRVITAGPLNPSVARQGGQSPSRSETITGGSVRNYLDAHQVFFNPFITSEALQPILSLFQLPLIGTASEIVTAWYRIRMSRHGLHKLPNGVRLATIEDGGVVSPGWIAFYENPGVTTEVTTEGNRGAPPVSTTETTAPVDDPIQNTDLYQLGQNASGIASIADLRRADDQAFSTPRGRTLNTFLGDLPKRVIMGSGIASNMGPMWGLMQGMSDPAFNEFFFDTFSSDGGPVRGYIVFRPKPFWSIAEENNPKVGVDNWTVLKNSKDFGIVSISPNEDKSVQLATTDRDSFTYWMVESSYIGLGGIQQQQFMSANSQEGGDYFGRKLTFPIYEKFKAEILGMGLRKSNISSNYIQISSGQALSDIARDMATLTVKAWDWYFANHEFKSGQISTFLNLDHRIGRPVLMEETNEEGYEESVSHQLQLGSSPSGTTAIGVTRMIDWNRFRRLAEDRFKPGYLDDRIVYVPNSIVKQPFNPTQLNKLPKLPSNPSIFTGPIVGGGPQPPEPEGPG